jgi:hypothetical protein
MCLDDIEKGLVSLPMKKSTCTCKATLHKTCLNEWYNHKKEKVCPICLTVVESKYEYILKSSMIQIFFIFPIFLAIIQCMNRIICESILYIYIYNGKRIFI